MAVFSVNGIQLHVAQAGTGVPVLLLLHGFPEFSYGWRHQIEDLTRAGFQLWMPDQRGYHLSDKPPRIAAYSLDELAKDILGLADAMGRWRGGLPINILIGSKNWRF